MSVPIDPLNSTFLPPRGSTLEAPKSIRETAPSGLPESLNLVIVHDDASPPSTAAELAKRLRAITAIVDNLQRQLLHPHRQLFLDFIGRDFRRLKTSLGPLLSHLEHPLRVQLRGTQLVTISHLSGPSYSDAALAWVTAVDLALMNGIYAAPQVKMRREGEPLDDLLRRPDDFGGFVKECWPSIVQSWRLRWIDCQTLIAGLRNEERLSTPPAIPDEYLKEARRLFQQSPKATKQTLMTRLGCGSGDATKIIQQMRKEGLCASVPRGRHAKKN